MTAAYRQEANVANAQKSPGPKTEKGKHRTRLNAYRHGLTGRQICLLTADEHEAFDRHCTGIRESLEPVGALEIDLAQSIAEDRWRLKRARALEIGIFALGHLGQLGALPTSDRDDPAQLPIDEALSRARTWLAKSESFQLLALAVMYSTPREHGPVPHPSGRAPGRPTTDARRSPTACPACP